MFSIRLICFSLPCGHTFCGQCIAHYTHLEKNELVNAHWPNYEDFEPEDDDFDIDDAITGRQSTGEFCYLKPKDPEFDNACEVWAARTEVREVYEDWLDRTSFQPLYRCPTCRDLYTERPHRVVALAEVCELLRAKEDPGYEAPPAAFDNDVMWSEYFPALKFCHRGEYGLKHTLTQALEHFE